MYLKDNMEEIINKVEENMLAINTGKEKINPTSRYKSTKMSYEWFFKGQLNYHKRSFEHLTSE